MASWHWVSSSSFSGCLKTYEWPSSSLAVKFSDAVSRQMLQSMQLASTRYSPGAYPCTLFDGSAISALLRRFSLTL